MTRLLFVTSNRIGDAVLSTGILGQLLETLPNPRVTIACGPAAASLFSAVPGLTRVIAMGKRAGGLHWLGLWARSAWRLWDVVVDIRGSAISYLVPVRNRIIGGRPDDALHRVAALGRLLGADHPPPPRLWLNALHREMAARLVPHPGASEETPVLAVGPAANWRGKQWRAAFFAELARRLTAPDGILPGARIAVLAAGHERPQAAPVLASVPEDRRIDLVGIVNPLEAYAVLSRCALFIGNDSGLMHLAAAAGIPTLGLFGPSRERHYAPWGPKGMVVRTQKPYEELIGGPGYDHRATGTLMDSLTVSMAERAAIELWHRGAPSSLAAA